MVTCSNSWLAVCCSCQVLSWLDSQRVCLCVHCSMCVYDTMRVYIVYVFCLKPTVMLNGLLATV